MKKQIEKLEALHENVQGAIADLKRGNANGQHRAIIEGFTAAALAIRQRLAALKQAVAVQTPVMDSGTPRRYDAALAELERHMAAGKAKAEAELAEKAKAEAAAAEKAKAEAELAEKVKAEAAAAEKNKRKPKA
jgi:colicin import membrane protein